MRSCKELVDAEKEADRLTEEYRKGTGSYLASANALKKAARIRENILNCYRDIGDE